MHRRHLAAIAGIIAVGSGFVISAANAAFTCPTGATCFASGYTHPIFVGAKQVYTPPATTTTTVAPTTVAPTTTMNMPTTTAGPTTTTPAGVQFDEQFTGNVGLDRFRTAVYNRNLFIGFPAGHDNGTALADHDAMCGTPDTKRVVSEDPKHADTLFYLCKDHLMTDMPDMDGYSIAMFAPNQTFASVSKVCWDVTLTDELQREWWDVSIVSATAGDYFAPSWLAGEGNAGGPGVVAYEKGGAHFAWGPFSHHLEIGSPAGLFDDTNHEFTSGADLATRYTNCAIDNGNGTATFTQMQGTTPYSYTAKVTWPTGPVKVVFGHHGYTPDKDGVPVSHTFHWDAIEVS